MLGNPNRLLEDGRTEDAHAVPELKELIEELYNSRPILVPRKEVAVLDPVLVDVHVDDVGVQDDIGD